jgi:hypothetical protein
MEPAVDGKSLPFQRITHIVDGRAWDGFYGLLAVGDIALNATVVNLPRPQDDMLRYFMYPAKTVNL